MSYKSRLPAIAAQLPVRLDAIAAGGAELIAAQAKSRAPVRTGKLRDAIHVERTGFGDYEVIAGNADVFYAHIVEGGSVHTPAHPFMIPALESSREQIIGAAVAALRTL